MNGRQSFVLVSLFFCTLFFCMTIRQCTLASLPPLPPPPPQKKNAECRQGLHPHPHLTRDHQVASNRQVGLTERPKALSSSKSPPTKPPFIQYHLETPLSYWIQNLPPPPPPPPPHPFPSLPNIMTNGLTTLPDKGKSLSTHPVPSGKQHGLA